MLSHSAARIRRLREEKDNSVGGLAQQLTYEAHTKCHAGFQRLLAYLERSPNQSELEIAVFDIRNELDKYRVWAGNVGAVHSGARYQISLDYRLRQSTFYQQQVTKVLGSLERALIRTLTFLEGEEISLEQQPKSFRSLIEVTDYSTKSSAGDSDAEDSPWEVSDTESESEKLGEQGQRNFPKGAANVISLEPETTVMKAATTTCSKATQLLESVRFIVNCLYRLPIRRPAPIDRIKESGFVGLYEHFDVLYVRDKFPEADDKLVFRLGKMITRRRQVLSYRRTHDEALRTSTLEELSAIAQNPVILPATHDLGHNNDKPVEPDAVTASQKSKPTVLTKATTLQIGAPEIVGRNILYPESLAESQSSIASSYAVANLDVKIPPRVRGENGQVLENFQCPYCFTAVYVNRTDKRAWKKHVLSDVQPYVCTYADCEMYDEFFDDRDSWFQHETSRHHIQYHCNEEGHQYYSATETFIAHMANEHGVESSATRSAALLSMFQRPLQTPSEHCQLCSRQTRDLKNHMSRHLQTLALFALPRLLSEEQADSARKVKGISKSTETSEVISHISGDTDHSPNSAASSVTIEADANRNQQRSIGPPPPDFVEQVGVPDTDDISWDLITPKFKMAREGMITAESLEESTATDGEREVGEHRTPFDRFAEAAMDVYHARYDCRSLYFSEIATNPVYDSLKLDGSAHRKHKHPRLYYVARIVISRSKDVAPLVSRPALDIFVQLQGELRRERRTREMMRRTEV